MNRVLSLRLPTPAASKLDDQAFGEFEKKLVQKYESELAANRDTNQQTGPYVRKKLIQQLLAARGNDPTYAEELRRKFPNYANEIQSASQELATWKSPLDVRARSNNAVSDSLTWPAPSQLANTLTSQAQSSNPEYRRRVATDLIARSRLVNNDAWQSIESYLPAVFPQARLLAARIEPEEYPLLRLELLSLPLADQNRVYYIRNLAIDIQNLMRNNGEGQTIRSNVHNAAGPANVPLVGNYLLAYFNPDDQGNKPTADQIALLMLARRWLKAGDLSAVQKIAGDLEKAFGKREPSIDRALSASDAATALEHLEAFISANVRLAESAMTVPSQIELVQGNDGPVPPDAIQAIVDCANAIRAQDASAALAAATRVHSALTAIRHPHSFQNVLSHIQRWHNGNAAYLQHANQQLTAFIQSAALPSKGDIRAALTATGQAVGEDLVDRVVQLFAALRQNDLDTVYQLYPQLSNDLRNTPAHATFARYANYIQPAYRNQYPAATIAGWLTPAFRTMAVNPLQGGSSSGATYSSMDVYEKLAELYEEISALYNRKADISLLEHSFPMWAPKSVRQGLHRVTAHLKADDPLYAANEIAALRETIRGEILPSEGPRAQLISVLEKLDDPELSDLARKLEKDPSAAAMRLEELLVARTSHAAFTRSKGEIVAINNQSEAGLAVLNAAMTKLSDGDVEGAQALLPELTEHFQYHNGFSANVASSFFSLIYFAATNGAQQRWKLGSLKSVPPLKPDSQGNVPSPQEMAFLSTLFDRARANDPQGVRNAWNQVHNRFQYYPNYSATLGQVAQMINTQPVLQLVPFIEEFVEQNRGASDEEIRNSLVLADGSDAPMELKQALIDLRGRLNEPPGQENLRLIQLDGLLEDISTNLLASLGEELADVTEANLGKALLALQAAVRSANASGLPDVNQDGGLAATRMLTPFGPSEEETNADLPEMRELAARLDAVIEKKKLGKEDVAELREISEQISERVWKTYVDLKEVFEPRLERAKSQQGVSDPFFVDNLIKQGPLTHLKAIADAVHDFASKALGSSGREVGAVLENPKGVRVMSHGRAVLKRIVIADTLRDVPKKAVLDENTLLILGRVGNDNISMAGSVVVNRAAGDGSGAGGQFSHIFVWTRNTGIAGVAFENATKVVADFQEKFADKLEAGEEIYVEAGREGFRLATVSEAIERGWMKEEEREELRPGLNTFVRFMVPDGLGKTRPHLSSMYLKQKRPNKPFLEIDLAFPMARINNLGEEQLTFDELMNAGPNGVHADSLVGPKAAVLARARHLLNWQNVVLPGHTMPFGQVCRLLEDSGALDEIRKIEPAMTLDAAGFWTSKLMTDSEHRAKQCEAIQSVIRRRLRAHLFESDGKTPNSVARDEILDPLKASGHLVDGSTGKLKPLIARSSANTEDSADFNAAGKHKTVANLVTEEAIVDAAIEVIASLYNLEAMETRRLFGVDTRMAAMSVLFQPVVEPEISGVLVTRPNEAPSGVFGYQATRGLFGGVHGDAEIQVAEIGANGTENKVLVPYRASKMAVLDREKGGVIEKDVPPELRSAQNLLTPQQEQTLYSYASQLKQFFSSHVYPGRNVELDIEFMISNGQILITQARPLPQPPEA